MKLDRSLRFAGRLLLFLLFLVCFLISLRLTIVSGVVADTYNLGAAQLFGGQTGLMLDWVRLGLLFLGTIVALFHLPES